MEQSLGQKSAMIDKLHQSSQKPQANLSCENQTEDCKLGLFQDSSYASDWLDSKSTSGGLLCVLGSHTFVPISWMCKKQSAVSHSSAESEIILLDAGFRVDGLPLFNFGSACWKHCPVPAMGNLERHKRNRVIPSDSHCDS